VVGARSIPISISICRPPSSGGNLQAKVDLGTRIGDQEGMIFFGHHNDQKDAQRHAEWSRRTADDIGPIFSGLAGVGHEIQNMPPVEAGGNRQPLGEAIMDLRNNAEGLRSFYEGRPIDPSRLQVVPQPTPWSQTSRQEPYPRW
jgi:hypothetical protein